MQIFKFFFLLVICFLVIRCQSGQKQSRIILESPIEIRMEDLENPKSVRIEFLGEYYSKDKSKRLIVIKMEFSNPSNETQTISPMNTELWDTKKEKYLPLYVGYSREGWGSVADAFTRIYTAQKGFAAFKDIAVQRGEPVKRTLVFEIPIVSKPESFQFYLLYPEKAEYRPLAKVGINVTDKSY